MSEAAKGHVPEENLTKYREFARIARQLDSLGNSVSNSGDYTKASALWSWSGDFWQKANALRVDLPEKS